VGQAEDLASSFAYRYRARARRALETPYRKSARAADITAATSAALDQSMAVEGLTSSGLFIALYTKKTVEYPAAM
jgi:hypothetical protein